MKAVNATVRRVAADTAETTPLAVVGCTGMLLYEAMRLCGVTR